MSADTISYHKIIGRNLRWVRIQNAFTQQQVASFLDITFQQVQKYESGANRISAGALLVLSKKMHVPVECFFQEDSIYNNIGNTHNIQNDTLEKQSVRLVRCYRKIVSEEMRKMVLRMTLECGKIL